MKYQLYTPCAQLKAYIRHIAISESEPAATYDVIPDTGLVMGFQYRGRISYLENGLNAQLSTAGITGMLDGYRIFSNTASTGSVLVTFTETGAANFFKQPLNELFSKSLSLCELVPNSQVKQIEEQLSEADKDTDRLKIIERFLLYMLIDVKPAAMVTAAVSIIKQTHGTIRITELATRLNTSASPLEKKFRSIVGASPKKFSSIVRIKSVLASVHANHTDFAEYLSGFYDQAHFIKDFKRFTSKTPEQYIRLIKTSS